MLFWGSQDILDDSFWGPQKRFFDFSFGGYAEGGALFYCNGDSKNENSNSLQKHECNGENCSGSREEVWA